MPMMEVQECRKSLVPNGLVTQLNQTHTTPDVVLKCKKKIRLFAYCRLGFLPGQTDFYRCNAFVGQWLYTLQEGMSPPLNREPFACGSPARVKIRKEASRQCVECTVSSYQFPESKESVLYKPVSGPIYVLVCDLVSP